MGLSFQNDYGTSLSLCIVIYDPRTCPRDKWSKIGWWNVPAGGRQTVLTGALNSRYYYFFARAADGGEWFDPRRQIDVPWDKFYLCAYDAPAQPNFRVGLMELDTGDHSDFLVRLTRRGVRGTGKKAVRKKARKK
jgi:uncharacterized membrane protein